MKKVYVIGIGMGNPETLTEQGKRAISACDGLTGATRFLEALSQPGQQLYPAISPKEILTWLEEQTGTTLGVLMSGDTGFYSGAQRLGDLIELKYGSRLGNAEFQVSYLPGISSLSYLAACLGVSWEDAKIVSLHGRIGDPVSAVRANGKTFFLTDGSENSPTEICKKLESAGLGQVKVYVGQRLSYESQEISAGSAGELAEKQFDPLSAMLVFNGNPEPVRVWQPGIPDDCFIRGQVPMTKEEVRTVTLSKLRMQRGDVMYDVGAGTGSVAVEMALACPEGKVFAIETNGEAVALIEANKAKFAAENLQIVRGMAPEALRELPAPQRAFLGGTKGNMAEILQVLLAKNPQIRMVINTVTLESLTEAMDCIKQFKLQNVEILQINVSKAKALGDYNLMMGQNPVYIISAEGSDRTE